jgi:uncharacterized protein (DUF169 family)
MKKAGTDLTILEKFKFASEPVSVKFLLNRPKGMALLEKKLALCEIIREAFQRPDPFYFAQEQEDCFGKAILGMVEADKSLGASGVIGYKWGIFQEPRANARLYHHNYHLEKGIANFVAFAPFSRREFDPDLLLIKARPEQSEVILRALSFASGELYESKSSPVLGCSWLLTYPYLSGKVNYMLTDLQTHGMKGRQVFENGWVLISIPFNWLAPIVASLKEMVWDLPEYSAGRDYFLRERDRILAEAIAEMVDGAEGARPGKKRRSNR